jgi:hypothetical protein
MSDEYRNSFISSLVIDEHFDVEEFENFTAKIRVTRNPLFKNIEYPWSICFEVDDEKNKLVWTAIEYDYEEFDSGTLVMSGTVRVVIKDFPSDFLALDVHDENASEFISCFFPVDAEITQVYPDKNIFFVSGTVYNFDTMKCGDNHIHFEFCT